MRDEIYEKAVYHCQQAVEKTVKAILICFGAYEKIHYVSNILRKEVERRDLKEYSKEIAESAFKDAQKTLMTGNDFVKWWFENK
jgi:hypothetical protein